MSIDKLGMMMCTRLQSVAWVRTACRIHRGGLLKIPLLSKLRCPPVKQLVTEYSQSTHYQSLVKRGVIQEQSFKATINARVETAEIATDGKVVTVCFDDGHITRFHSEWLRNMCFCPHCRADSNGEVKVYFGDIPDRLELTSVKKEGDDILLIEWNDNASHVGIFPVAFLRKHCYDNESRKKHRKSTAIQFYTNEHLPEVNFQEVMETNTGLYKWLKNINEYGASLVTNMPTQEGELIKIIERVGPVQSTSYGEIFDVKVDVQPCNEAYSSNDLLLHQDLTYYSAPPGIQLLHCIRFDDTVKGGESEVADLFHIAEKFRKDHPEDFKILTRIPATWCDVHYGRKTPVDMWYRRTHFVLNEEGDLIEVTWKSQSQGPLFTNEEDIEPYYRAYRKLSLAVRNNNVMYKFRLKPGNMITVNNRRMMHGRSKFEGEPGQRFLQGGYIQIDDFKSRLQVLSNLVGDGSPPKRVFNMDPFC